jgi:hypothetical protein
LPKAKCQLCGISVKNDDLINIKDLNILTPVKKSKQLIRLERVCHDCWSVKGRIPH